MICFSNAKINIGLYVTSRRGDGYHNIETLYYPVDLSDIVEVTMSDEKGGGRDCFKNSGLTVNVASSSNLCMRALEEFRHNYPVGAMSIHLHKIIPPGSGLGGGSSNAASVIKALNEILESDLTNNELASIAGRVGSDCPFFIHNRPVFASGRGDIFEPAGLSLAGYRILIICPDISVSTAWAYSKVKPSNTGGSLKDLAESDPMTWQDRIVNEFETAVFRVHPIVGRIKKQLIDKGAVFSSMSGSGSAVYGLFEGDRDISDIEVQFAGMFTWSGLLK